MQCVLSDFSFIAFIPHTMLLQLWLHFLPYISCRCTCMIIPTLAIHSRRGGCDCNYTRCIFMWPLSFTSCVCSCHDLKQSHVRWRQTIYSRDSNGPPFVFFLSSGRHRLQGRVSDGARQSQRHVCSMADAYLQRLEWHNAHTQRRRAAAFHHACTGSPHRCMYICAGGAYTSPLESVSRLWL